MVLRLIATVIKILLASLAVGVILSQLDITPEQVLAEIGLTPDQISNYLITLFHWAIPHLILGGVVVLPVWLVIFLFRPPRRSD
ncbi:MAG: hypothetical protein JKY32_16020 [Rhizobiales bacterium]|nr:hypothetical protein [Hyphomicrobiales bacterium]